MLIRVENGIAKPYSLNKLFQDNPNISFPEKISEEILNSFNVYTAVVEEKPFINENTHKIENGDILLKDQTWTKTWQVVELTADEIQEKKVKLREEKRKAYQEFSDPIYFKWLRGEATEEDWLAAVKAVKEWYDDAN